MIGGTVLATLTSDGVYELVEGDITNDRLDFFNRGQLKKLSNDDPSSDESVIAGPFTNEGVVSVEAATLLLTGGGTHRGSQFNLSAGTVHLRATHLVKAERTIEGTNLNFQATGLGDIILGGSFEIEPGARAQFVKATVEQAGQLVNKGTSKFSRTLTVDGFLDTELGGLTVGNVSQASEQAGVVVIGDGEQMDGTGRMLTSNGTYNLGGKVKPGKSPGVLTIEGDYFQEAGGTTVLEIGGTVLGDSHDQLVVTGDAEIAGEVWLEFIDGFAPTTGQQFDDLLDVHGDLDLGDANFVVRNLADGFQFDVTPMAGGFMFTALSDGVFVDPLLSDFDDDGTVDGGDLLTWQRNIGTTLGAGRADGDADGNGSVDAVDLGLWQNQFGNVAASPASAIPEPASWLLAIVIFAVAGCRCRPAAHRLK